MDTTQSMLRRLVDAGLTQVEISRRTQIPQPRISRWLAAGAPRSVEDGQRLTRLAQEAGVLTPAANDSESAHAA